MVVPFKNNILFQAYNNLTPLQLTKHEGSLNSLKLTPYKFYSIICQSIIMQVLLFVYLTLDEIKKYHNNISVFVVVTALVISLTSIELFQNHVDRKSHINGQPVSTHYQDASLRIIAIRSDGSPLVGATYSFHQTLLTIRAITSQGQFTCSK